MRISGALVIAGLAAALTALGAQPGPDAGAVMTAARKALGGEKRLSAVKSLSLTGRTLQVRGQNPVTVEFEILCELPDRCARTDDPAAPQGTAPRVLATAVEHDFVRLTLAMFAASRPGSSLTFSYVGQAEVPRGNADVIEVRGPDKFAVRLFIDRTSRLPVIASWTSAAAVRPGAVMTEAAHGAGAETQPGGPSPRQAGGAGVPRAETAATPQPSPHAAQPGVPASEAGESRVYYDDYREVDGLLLPFRLRRTVGGETVEETIVERYRINPKRQ